MSLLFVVRESRVRFSKGPALRMELVHSESKDTPSALKILADKGNILKGGRQG